VLLLGLLAVLAVALAAVGLYGVVAYIAAQRTREIAVRMALGARASQVVRLILWQGVRPSIAGLVIGVAGALALGRVMAGLLYQVPPHDPFVIAAAVAGLSIVVLAACVIPARRAARTAPAEALRLE
jgi:ABC-type antimicrobial peptide transport system permease subunit